MAAGARVHTVVTPVTPAAGTFTSSSIRPGRHTSSPREVWRPSLPRVRLCASTTPSPTSTACGPTRSSRRSQRYIAIPNVSPAFDADWAEPTATWPAPSSSWPSWCRTRPIAGLTRRGPASSPGCTPVDRGARSPPLGGGDPDDTVAALRPPRQAARDDRLARRASGRGRRSLDGDRLYGRGGADDGYAAFASLAAIEAVQAAGGAHARCVVLIEASEESGSPDLPAHLDALADRLGSPSLVRVPRLGLPRLRAAVGDDVAARPRRRHPHRRDPRRGRPLAARPAAWCPSSFRIVRQLLDRIEDATTGACCCPSVPRRDARRPPREAEATATPSDALPSAELPVRRRRRGPIAPTTRSSSCCARTWRPTLSVVGADGLPPTTPGRQRAAPVHRAAAVAAPAADVRPDAALDGDRRRRSPPTRRTAPRCTFDRVDAGRGWNAPSFAPWLADALDDASQRALRRARRAPSARAATIPFMGMLGARFPEAQFVITGVLGPDSNAHGPNEFLAPADRQAAHRRASRRCSTPTPPPLSPPPAPPIS